MSKKNVTTSSGFGCEVNADKLDDMRVFEAIMSLQSGEDSFTQLRSALFVLTALIGEEQKEALYEHLVEKEGQAYTGSFRRELTEIMAAVPKSKKK